MKARQHDDSCAAPAERHAVRTGAAPRYFHGAGYLVFYAADSTAMSPVDEQKLLAMSHEQQKRQAICVDGTGFADQGERDPERLSILHAGTVTAILG